MFSGKKRNVITLLFCALLTFLCAALWSAPSQAQSEKIRVVATFSILHDLVTQIGGERVEVTALVGPDGDAHVYAPSPADARKLAQAQLIVSNGIGLEGWMSRLIRSSGSKALAIEASRGITPLKAKDHHGHAHDHGDQDPHAWQDVSHIRHYVSQIRDALIQIDPSGKAAYEVRTLRYLEELALLDKDIRLQIAQIPQERRKVITGHNAFGYFEKAYGIDFIAPQGVSTESEASARDVARLIRLIRREKAPAVFLENISDERLIIRIGQETGAKLGGRLYSDALSPPSGPAGTYITMMRHNLRTMTEALKP
jgi:zinc/manganese transport system substrate-binding protein